MRDQIKKKQFAVALLVMVCTSACSKDWLEEKVDKTKTIPTSVKDFQAILDEFSVISINSNVPINEIAADGHYYSDAAWMAYSGTLYENMYTWSRRNPYEGLYDWYSPYVAVLNLNIVLDGVDKIDDPSNMGLNNVRAQALLHRAKIFFSIAQSFAPPYSEGSADTDMGIPLRLSSDITIPTTRSSLGQTYQQIIKDLKMASDYLPVKDAYPTRATRTAAFALLARTYFYMERYDSAMVYANKCLQLNSYLLDYNTVPASNNFIGLNDEVILFGIFLPNSPITSDYLVDEELYKLYDDDDLRKSRFFRRNNGLIEFKGHYTNSPVEVFAGIATDEVYLIRAECFAREGRVDYAMKDLNALLRARWRKIDGMSTYIDKAISDPIDAIKAISIERRKELILRNVRWSELRRLNKDPRFSVVLTRSVGGETHILEPNSYKYTFPIPYDIIRSTGMKQNPGWGEK